jgi:hypothetical protein
MAQTQSFRANFDFNAKEEDELDLLSGDILDVAQVHDGNLQRCHCDPDTCFGQ